MVFDTTELMTKEDSIQDTFMAGAMEPTTELNAMEPTTELFGFIGLFGLNKKAWAAKHAKEASAARKRALSSQK